MTPITMTGKLIEIGNMDEGRGILLESEGEFVQVIGLTEEECIKAAERLGNIVMLTITEA